MTLAEALLLALLNLPCPADEPRIECAPWRAQVAEAIAQVAQESTCTEDWAQADCKPLWSGAADELAATLSEIAYHESGLRKRIQAGQCRKDECDAISIGGNSHRHLARSMWQLHATPNIPGTIPDVPRKVWLASVGTDPQSLLVACRAAVRVLVHNPKGFGITPGKGARGKAAWRILGNIRKAAEQKQDNEP